MVPPTRSAVPSKTRKPRLGPRAVVRGVLGGRLDEGLQARLMLVTAPAGFGKSWLVADWLDAHPDVAQCWVTVDRLDNDPIRLWRHVIESVRLSACPDASVEAQQLLSSAAAGLPLIVDALAAGLAELDEDMIIVLDDVHALESVEAVGSLRRFLDLLSPRVHLVLVGRHDAAMPLAKYRLAGEVVELRTVDLRCSLEESQSVVAESMGLDLDEAVVAQIQHKTMGWMAGIRLAAASVAADSDAKRAASRLPAVGALDGAYEAIGAYLVEEALDDLPEADRDFLLDTSILVDLSGPLCAAVSGRGDSAQVLARLEQIGMFISRIDDTGTGESFRYQDLFRDALGGVLHRRAPDRERELHRRAAEWLHDDNDTVRAVQHALAAGEPDVAASWLTESSRDFIVAKEVETLCTLFDEVDNAAESLSPIAQAARAFAVVYGTGNAAEIDVAHLRARDSVTAMTAADEQRLADQWKLLPEPFHESPQEFVRLVDATMAHRHGDIDLAARNLHGQGGEASESGWIEMVAGEMLIQADRFTEGMALVQRWFDYAFSSSDPIPVDQLVALVAQAWVGIGQGRLAEAEALADRAVELMRVNGLGDHPQAAVATVPLAWVAFEQGDVDTADALIAPVMDRLADYGEVPALVYACALVARIHHVRGNHRDAAAVLNSARLLNNGRVVAGLFADRIDLEQTRLALLDNDLTGAEMALPDWRQRSDKGAGTMFEHLVLTRLAIACGDDPAAMFVDLPVGVEVTTTYEIELLKLRAHAAVRGGDQAAALDHLASAMVIAINTGHRQTFLDDTATFGALVDKAAAMTGLRLHAPRTVAPPQPGLGVAQSLTVPLTERELEVLRLLPSHLTYKHMADELYVSPNTIKSYVKNLYGKLDAHTRTEAVATARTLGFITESLSEASLTSREA